MLGFAIVKAAFLRIVLFLLTCGSFTLAQTTQPESLNQRRSEEEQRTLAELNALPELETKSLDLAGLQRNPGYFFVRLYGG